MRTLERAAQGDSQPWMVPNHEVEAITLEHILPLKPMENWTDWDAEDVKTYVKRLGNLALLKASTNSQLKSDGFADKSPHFAESDLETTKMIAGYTSWRPQDVVDRQEYLSSLALRAWPFK